ncbi:MAG: pyruvate kinase [Anaerolineales bacterium]|jgi:pyruvate kinase|nr:pyruvate kinase [Anaerolineales bacterium]HJO34405.1 pyruvate kinase [Anaerolineales bacterium]
MGDDLRKTRIICTIGPASNSEELLAAMMAAGMNVARLNFSHGTHEHHARVIDRIRTVGAAMGLPVAILQDLQGPRIRIGAFAQGSTVELQTDARFIITTEAVAGDSERVCTTYARLPATAQPGDRLLLDDGNLELEVESAHETEVVTRVKVGGTLHARKGINLPGVQMDIGPLTEKDRADLTFGLQQGVDYVAVSFVQCGQDIDTVRATMREINAERVNTPIIAKLERPAALDNLEQILDHCEGVMVARGDLGVEIGAQKVPSAQKRIIELANERGNIVVTATQMLESMISTPRPTRAEASDVANAIFDGTDAVMLSAETAVGEYPLETVRTIAEIIREAEQHEDEWGQSSHRAMLQTTPVTAVALARAARELAQTLGAAAIAVFTRSGRNVRLVSKTRPPVPIMAFTSDAETYTRMALFRGVVPFQVPRVMTLEEMTRSAEQVLLQSSPLDVGDQIVIIAGIPIADMRPANIVLLHTIGGDI